MKKIIILCIVTLIALSAFAQSPRLMSMGNVDGYVADADDIFTYPGAIHNYGNTAYAYLGQDAQDDYWKNFGINVAFNNYIIGAYFNKPVMWNPTFMVLNDVELDKQMDLFFGFNESLAIYLTLALDGYSEPGDDPDNEDTEVAMCFGLGGGYSTDKMDIGIHVSIPVYGRETSYSVVDPVEEPRVNSVEESESKFALALDGRMTFAQVGNVDFVGKADIMFAGGTYDDGNDATKDKEDSMLGFGIGVAGVYNYDENNKVVVGFTPIDMLVKSEDDGLTKETDATVTFPAFNIGIESQVCKWLVLRAGMTQEYSVNSVTTEEDNEDDQVTTTWDSDFMYNMGMGIMFRNFTLDFVFNEDFLHDGPNFITGQNTDAFAGELMLKYKF